MPYAVISYRVKPGFEEEIKKIFSGFRRVDSPVFRSDEGERAGRLLGTGVFLKDDVLVRVIHYEGDFGGIAGHMSSQSGVHGVEAALAPYLAEQRDTGNREGFEEYFRNATMECISQLTIDTHPAAGS